MTLPVSIVHDWLVFHLLSNCSSWLDALVDGFDRRGASRALASTQALFLSYRCLLVICDCPSVLNGRIFMSTVASFFEQLLHICEYMSTLISFPHPATRHTCGIHGQLNRHRIRDSDRASLHASSLCLTNANACPVHHIQADMAP